MIQAHREDGLIVEPLLKTLLILENQVEIDSEDSSKDILVLLLNQIVTLNAASSDNVELLRTCLGCVNKLQLVIPGARG